MYIRSCCDKIKEETLGVMIKNLNTLSNNDLHCLGFVGCWRTQYFAVSSELFVVGSCHAFTMSQSSDSKQSPVSIAGDTDPQLMDGKLKSPQMMTGLGGYYELLRFVRYSLEMSLVVGRKLS